MKSEFERIDLFLEAFQRAGGSIEGGSVSLGPGDDAAIFSSARRLVVTTDAVVENVHFRLDWATPEQIGHKALAVNLSDVAAMGASIETFTCALALPASFPDEKLVGIASGMGALAHETGAVLSGGNFTKASELSITVTAIGSLSANALRRNSAQPGDVVLLVGEVGVAASELRLLMQGQPLPEGPSALHEPAPLLEAGERASRLVRCGIDVSDGLSQDLGHVAKASAVRLVIDARTIPRSSRFERLTREMGESEKLSLLVGGGEDYALVIIGAADAIESLRSQLGGEVIGRVETGEGVDFEGLPEGVPLGGHDHFRTE